MGWVECPYCGGRPHDTTYPSASVGHWLSDADSDAVPTWEDTIEGKRLHAFMEDCWICYSCGSVLIPSMGWLQKTDKTKPYPPNQECTRCSWRGHGRTCRRCPRCSQELKCVQPPKKSKP